MPARSPTRAAIAEDTLARTESIITEHASQGATADSTFYSQQLDPLDQAKCPNFPSTPIQVFNSDSYVLARQLVAVSPEARGKVAVQNLASDLMPAGPWLKAMSVTQEEALCYSSTLYATLKPEYYPWPNVGEGSIAGIYSPGVVIFKDELDNKCEDLAPENRLVVSVITVAAPRHQVLTPDRTAFKWDPVLEAMKGKIRLVYRMAAHNGQTHLVLGAMGCGAYGCPPRLVAELMRDIILEDEFKGWFSRVAFACYSKSPYERKPTNFEVFSDVFRDVSTRGN